MQGGRHVRCCIDTASDAYTAGADVSTPLAPLPGVFHPGILVQAGGAGEGLPGLRLVGLPCACTTWLNIMYRASHLWTALTVQIIPICLIAHPGQ